jgi:hypothetical protein
MVGPAVSPDEAAAADDASPSPCNKFARASLDPPIAPFADRFENRPAD